MRIKLKDHESFESALRRFKRSVDDSGILIELKERMAYEKPSDTKKKNLNSAKRRQQKKQEKEGLGLKRMY